MTKMANISKKSKRFKAMVELLNGKPIKDVEAEYGESATAFARVAIQGHAEAKKIVGQRQLTKTKKKITTSLIGCKKYIRQIVNLLKYGNKAVFVGGYHGLGKTSMVYEAAKVFDAEVIRFQVTEALSEVDIIGSVDLATGKFINSQLVNKILEAAKHPEKTYILFFDEFTRGRPEALNVLFPILAERTLYNNSVYAEPELKEIKLSSNVKVIGTGNVNDKGLRDVGEAEFDRWNGVEVLPITETESIKRLIEARTHLRNEAVVTKMVNYYQKTWQYGNEMRILPMSHRTLIEACELTSRKITDGKDPIASLKETLDETYFVASQAILNPNFKQTYQQLKREVF